MWKRLAITAGVFFGLMVPVVAFAQESETTDFTSYEPLQRVIEGFAEGESVSDTVQINDDLESPVVSSLQFVVNLGWAPAFIDPDLPVVPSGLAGPTTADLESLEWAFEAPFNTLPPLHPWGTDEGVVDIDPLFEDWGAYGEDGLIDGPIIIEEPPTTVWAIELAEPFDQTCGERRYVGRTWKGEGITTTEGPFTEAALGGTYGVLADGENSRFIGLECRGGEPTITAVRMNPDRDRAQTFGPTNVVALVRDNHVIFFSKLRFLGLDEPDIEPEFYANNPGDDIVTFKPAPTDVPALLPNPYDEYSSRIEIVMDLPDAEALAGESGARALLHKPSTQSAIRTGTGACEPPIGNILWLNPLEQFFAAWGSQVSSIFFGTTPANPDILNIAGPTPDGQDFKATIDWKTGVVTVTTDECEGTGTATGELIGDAESTAQAGEGDDPPEDEAVDSGAAPEPEPISEGDSGAPWGLIAFAIVAVALATTAIIVGRSRTRTKDCKPLEEAWLAAIAASDQAKKTLDHWQSERDHWNERRGDAQTDTGHAELIELANEKFAEAESHRGEAQTAFDVAADTVWKAQIALQNCRGETTAPPPVPVPVPPDTPGPPPPEESEPSGCTEGETRQVADQSASPRTFVIAEVVKLRLPTAQWAAFAPGGDADPKALYGLDASAAEALLSDLANRAEKNYRPSPEIVLTTITVRCDKIEQCSGSGQWVDTGKRTAVRTSTPAGSIEVPVSKRLRYGEIAEFIAGELRDALRPYIEAEKELDEYTCD